MRPVVQADQRASWFQPPQRAVQAADAPQQPSPPPMPPLLPLTADGFISAPPPMEFRWQSFTNL